MGYERPAFPIPNKIREKFQLPDLSGLSISPFSANKKPESFSEIPQVNTLKSVDYENNLFTQPISTDEPLPCFQRSTHEVLMPTNMENPQNRAVETNKFYGNMFVESQTCPVWTHPYSLWWCKEPGFSGMAVSYIEDKQKVFGPGDPPQYYFSPTNIKSFVFGSTSFQAADDMELAFENPKHMSIQSSILLKSDKSKKISFPLVQGMGFVTALYNGLNPKLQSAIGIRHFENLGKISGTQTTKFSILLENEVRWSLYVFCDETERQTNFDANLELNQIDGQTLVPVSDLSSIPLVFQLIPASLDVVDTVAGNYLVDCELKGEVSDNDTGKYSFNYSVQGSHPQDGALIFCMPHHVQTMTENTKATQISPQITLDSTVYGKLSGYRASFLEFQVETPGSQYSLTHIESKSFSQEQINAIGLAATSEVQNGKVDTESNLDSMYFSGKALAKYAWILYTTHYILRDRNLTVQLLENLKVAFQKFVSNKQILPLNYDTTWGGLVSSGTSFQDFGNSYYNDHHFHYGYHVLTGAIIAQIDHDVSGGNDEWLQANKQWINNLVRDFANPSDKDPFFPVFRSFDWFGGHSWAKGLFASGDGKDQESSSEDANAAYALKIWGQVSKNTNLEKIADLKLGIMKNSFNNYFLYSTGNTVEPDQFIRNKVAGIFFENKIDHATYFGNNIEYIQMIHAIPINPISTFIRSPQFVKEEFEEKLKPVVDNINDGWKGIIMLNVALYDPQQSYRFFNLPDFPRQYLDGGQSLTWSLAFAASMTQ
ncbi:hypothetical protein ACO0QE_002693 [Hanseniaspora vineae]